MKKAAVVVAGLVLALFPLAAPADAAGPVLAAHAASTIPIYAGGVAAYVPVTYACAPRWGGSNGYAIADVMITEHLAGERTVEAASLGGVDANLTCDGRSHFVRLAALYDGVQPPVAVLAPTPSAQVRVDLLACNAAETDCRSPSFSSTSRLVDGGPLASPAIDPDARLLVGRGGAAVRLRFSCPPGSQESVQVTLTQRVSATRTVQSSGYPIVRFPQRLCDGRTHTGLVAVPPPAPDRFRAGVAWVEADLADPSDLPQAYATVDLQPTS